MIYLLHSTVPLGTTGRNSAQHYLGYCEEDALLERVKAHQSGKSDAAIVRAFKEAGGLLLLGAVWPKRTRADERRMKTAGHLANHCLICQEAKKGGNG